MTRSAETGAELGQIALTYHERTKHRLERYAAGPETLDWDMQPNPFREYKGCPRIVLPLAASRFPARFAELFSCLPLAPAEPSIVFVGALLQLSFGISAWKQYSPDRWALRCNPSSGNLHPTEAYLVSRSISGLEDGLYHYMTREHALEQRLHRPYPAAGNEANAPFLWIGLSSIH